MKRSRDGLNDSTGKKICIAINDIICPITKEIFYMPVTADDGFTYEKWAIDQHMQSGISPMTRESIKSYADNIVMKNIITGVLQDNPDLKSEQFASDTYYNFAQNRKGWMKLLSNKNFEEFSKFKEIHLLDKATDNYRSLLVIEYVCEHCTNIETFKNIVLNAIDVNCFHNSHSPMFYVASSKNKDIIISSLDTQMDISNISTTGDDNLITVIMNNRYLSDDDKRYILEYIINNKHILKVFTSKPMCLTTLTDTEHFSNSISKIVADSITIQKLIDIDVLPRLYLDDSIKIIDQLESIEIKQDDVYDYYKNKYVNKSELTSINQTLKQYYEKIKNSSNFDVGFKKTISAKLHQFYKDKIGIDAIDNMLLLDYLIMVKNKLEGDKRMCGELYKEICG